MSRVEEPRYRVLETQGDIEIRDYDPMIVAEVAVGGDQNSAIRKGFRILAGYIFGDNVSSGRVAMTAPVIRQPSRKIAMTAPVLREEEDGGGWHVRFVMPQSYTMDTLPRPRDAAVRLREVASTRYAVIRFSGWASARSLKRHTDQLTEFLNGRGIAAGSIPIHAFYDPPWTLPFLRRNEVLIELPRLA